MFFDTNAADRSLIFTVDPQSESACTAAARVFLSGEHLLIWRVRQQILNLYPSQLQLMRPGVIAECQLCVTKTFTCMYNILLKSKVRRREVSFFAHTCSYFNDLLTFHCSFMLSLWNLQEAKIKANQQKLYGKAVLLILTPPVYNKIDKI